MCVGAHLQTRCIIFASFRRVSRSRVCTQHPHTYFCMHAYICYVHRYVTRATDTCKRSRPLFFSHSLSYSFSLSPPPLPFYRSLTLVRSVYPTLILFTLPLYPPTALFKYPPLPPLETFYSFSLSLCFSLFRSLPLLLPTFVSFYSIRFPPPLSVFPKLLPLSLAIAYTVEAAQAAEGHRSQLWTYLDRQARSEVWTSFGPRPCR